MTIYSNCFEPGYLKQWEIENCQFEIYHHINDSGTSIKYNPSKMTETQNDMSRLFTEYLKTYDFTDNVTSARFNPFQFVIAETCSSQETPGVCDKALTQYCKQYTRDDVANSLILTNLCGCYVPADPIITKDTPPQCDVLCNRSSTARKINQSTGQPITCDKNICAITDIIINDVNSNIQGGINFNSICSNCTGDSCRCVISGINISTLMANIGIADVNFNQFCDESSICRVLDDNGNIIKEGQCEPILKSQDIIIPKFSISPNFLILLLLIIIAIIVFIIILFTRNTRLDFNKISVQNEEKFEYVSDIYSGDPSGQQKYNNIV
jgi:hypothetical protein